MAAERFVAETDGAPRAPPAGAGGPRSRADPPGGTLQGTAVLPGCRAAHGAGESCSRGPCSILTGNFGTDVTRCLHRQKFGKSLDKFWDKKAACVCVGKWSTWNRTSGPTSATMRGTSCSPKPGPGTHGLRRLNPRGMCVQVSIKRGTSLD